MHAHAEHHRLTSSLRSRGVLDPMDRISELMFGLIMALTFTLTLGVATADAIETRTMVFAALGCNLAWGLIDAGLYLLTQVNATGRELLSLRALRSAPDTAAADAIVAEALPTRIAAVLGPDQLAQVREQLLRLPAADERPRLTRADWRGALGVFLITFLSTLPIVIPFVVIAELRLALRVSNVVAIAMLFACGYAFGYRTGIRPLPAALLVVVFGCLLVAIAIALGG